MVNPHCSQGRIVYNSLCFADGVEPLWALSTLQFVRLCHVTNIHGIAIALHHFPFKPKFKYTIGKEYAIFLNGDNLFVNQTFLYTVYI